MAQVVNPNARARSTALANFGFKRFDPSAYGNVADQIMIVGTPTPVEILFSLNSTVAAQIVYYCFTSMNDQIVSDVDLCGYYASLVIAFAPGLKDTFVDTLSGKGYQVTLTEAFAGQPLDGIELHGSFEYGLGLIYFGQSLLLLFKNISVSGYDKFMRSRINALYAFVGASSSAGVSFLLPKGKAEKIRGMLGSQQELRIQVVQFIMAASNLRTPFGAMCGYLCNILAWTDMTTIFMIIDALLVPKSPVIMDVRVASEIRNVCHAIIEINKCKTPQFFRIVEAPTVTRILEKANFPTLVVVAQTIRKEQNPSLNNFISVNAQNNPIVEDLVREHRLYLAAGRQNVLPSIAEYITSYDDPDLLATDPNAER